MLRLAAYRRLRRWLFTKVRLPLPTCLKANHTKIRCIPVPSVVFTVPVLAAVGMSEQAAQKQNSQFRVHRENSSNWCSSPRVGEDCSGFKVLIDESTGRLLGAHVLGPEADELINVFALAIQSQATAEMLQQTIFAYPTHGSDVTYML
jgi:glutathione reductase (NADPH)